MRLFIGLLISASMVIAAPTEKQKKAAESFRIIYTDWLKKQHAVSEVQMKWHDLGAKIPTFNLEIRGKAVNQIANGKAANTPEAKGLARAGIRVLMFHNTLTGVTWSYPLND